MDQLTSYAWPENIDELREFVRSACETSTGPVVQESELPEKIHLTTEAEFRPSRTDESVMLDEFLAEIERELLVRALRHAKGNKAKAARLLGVTRQRVIRRIEFFGLQ